MSAERHHRIRPINTEVSRTGIDVALSAHTNEKRHEYQEPGNQSLLYSSLFSFVWAAYAAHDVDARAPDLRESESPRVRWQERHRAPSGHWVLVIA